MLFSSLHTFLILLYKKIKRLTSYFRKKTYFLKKNRFLVQFLKHFYAFMIFLVIFSNLVDIRIQKLTHTSRKIGERHAGKNPLVE